MFVRACCLLAGLSSLSRAMSLTSVALLKLGCILMSETVNSWRKKFCYDFSKPEMETVFTHAWWGSGSAVVVTSYSPIRTFRMSRMFDTKGMLKN